MNKKIYETSLPTILHNKKVQHSCKTTNLQKEVKKNLFIKNSQNIFKWNLIFLAGNKSLCKPFRPHSFLFSCPDLTFILNCLNLSKQIILMLPYGYVISDRKVNELEKIQWGRFTWGLLKICSLFSCMKILKQVEKSKNCDFLTARGR